MKMFEIVTIWRKKVEKVKTFFSEQKMFYYRFLSKKVSFASFRHPSHRVGVLKDFYSFSLIGRKCRKLWALPANNKKERHIIRLFHFVACYVHLKKINFLQLGESEESVDFLLRRNFKWTFYDLSKDIWLLLVLQIWSLLFLQFSLYREKVENV